MLIVVQPFGESFHWAAPLCVFNALMMATYSLMTRALSHHVSTACLQQFYGGATGTLILAHRFAYAVWVTPDSALIQWLGLAWLGLCGWSGP